MHGLGWALALATLTMGLAPISAEARRTRRGKTDWRRMGPCAFGEPRMRAIARGGARIGTGKAAIRVLRRSGHALAYSPTRRAPLWACEKLQGPIVSGSVTSRIPIRSDPKLRRVPQPRPRDFRRTGFAPGFLLDPLSGGAHLRRRGQRFYRSNLVALRTAIPPSRRLWTGDPGAPLHVLQDHALTWAENYGTVWTITGPIFGARPKRVGRSRIQVPTHFFKILVRRAKRPRWRWLAIVVPNRALRGKANLEPLRKSVQWIEQRTGLRFFTRLDAAAVAHKKAKVGRWWPVRRPKLPDESGLGGLGVGPGIGPGERGGTGAGGLGGLGGPVVRNRRARVFMSRATVTGGLDAATIRRVIRRHLSELRYCYIARGLKANPKLRGMLSVHFVLSFAGAVESAKLRKSTLRHKPTEQCILMAVRRWRFPKPEGSKSRITYPFHFKPGP